MPTFVTLFAATDADLDRLLPGWPMASEEPLLVPGEDLFTGIKKVFKRWTAPAGALYGVAVPGFATPQSPIAPVLAPESDYELNVEQGAPRALRACPHACVVNFFGDHLLSLGALLLGREVEGRPLRVGPDGLQLDGLAQEAVAELSAVRPEELPTLAARWCQDIAAGFDDASEALWVLRRLHALARVCTESPARHLCLWVQS
jgi:hypothetical protein